MKDFFALGPDTSYSKRITLYFLTLLLHLKTFGTINLALYIYTKVAIGTKL